MITLEELRQRLSPEVRAEEKLAPYTTYRIGGPAQFYFEAKSADDAMKAVRVCREAGLPFFILGGGSNTLVADEGIRGLVIRMQNRGYSIDGTAITAEAGAPTALIGLRSVESGLAGFEWAGSLPGTIGGAVRGNAGCFGGDMRGSVESVRAFIDGQERTLSNAECGFGYRQSLFKTTPGALILSATLRLKPSPDPAASRAFMEKCILEKRAKQPVDQFSAGCVFTNWKPKDEQEIATVRKCLDLNKEETVPLTPGGEVPAGWIIDRAQLKGMKVGHMSISDKHCNFFVNDGQGRASELIALTSAVKMKIRDMTEGIIQLNEEIEYAGF